jgi:tRNA A-37 threonylcarbamoyl transferase component Bud32
MTETGEIPTLPPPDKESAPLIIPDRIGRFKIEGLLEKGGMSLLYLGVHPDTNESVIIKVLSPKYVENPDAVSRFLNEAKIISMTDHPNIIKLYEYGKWEGGLFIAMEFIRGTSLRKILSYQPLSLRRALEVILQTAYALCHLHTHGVVHGDLKPENILVDDHKQVKVIDFGIAQMLASKKEHAAQSSKLIGTPVYMSPEQHQDPQSISFQSDIYSLGIIAYELVLGKITHGRVIVSLAPRGMQPILQKALQPKVEDRYQDIVDFIIDISNYMNSQEAQKDKHGTDYFFELFERIENFQVGLLPQQTPDWNGVQIGRAHISGIGLNGLYYEFFEFDQEKCAVMVMETLAKGAEGILYVSTLRAIVRTLIKQHEITLPEHFCAQLLEATEDNFPDQKFLFGALFFDRKKQLFEYLHNDYGFLIHFDSKEKTCSTLLEEPTRIKSLSPKIQIWKQHLSVGDKILFLGYRESDDQAHALQLEKFLKTAFQESVQLDPQKQADFIMRKLRIRGRLVAEEHPLTLLTFQL